MTIENKDGAPELYVNSSNNINNSIDAVTENLNNMAVLDNNDTVITMCVNCGKEEDKDNSLKFCSACKMVKYCSIACQKEHRPLHKRECKQRAAELYDENLFQQPPPSEECPICFITMPSICKSEFQTCCGKNLCRGCIFAMLESGGGDLCAFCRMPNTKTDEEHVERLKKLMEKGNGLAFYYLAGYYARGISGLPQDDSKANELLLRGGQLGYSEAYYNLGASYLLGDGVEIDKKKAKHYLELAAISGYVPARHNVGCLEGQAGNNHRAYKHYILAARAGFKESLDSVRKGFMKGFVTKDEYASTLRAYQKSQDEMKSDTRDKASTVRARDIAEASGLGNDQI